MLWLMADQNNEGHLEMILQRLQSERWRDVWESLDVGVQTFDGLALPRDVDDDVLWQMCQQRGVILITSNRNADGPTSLEITLRKQVNRNSLPVFTLADPERVLQDGGYAEVVAEMLLERLFDIDLYRGVGRIYLP